jgi:rod shape-determining protein MreD
VRRGLMSCAIIAIALIVQLTIVNRLVFPGAGPDLVLLAVVALALTGGPASGAVTGFFAGLALDVAPPPSHVIGQNALVFCLAGYWCAWVAVRAEGPAGLSAAIAAAGAAAGAALQAAFGVLLSNPEVTWQAVRHVLPLSVIYDVVFSPFVLYVVVHAVWWATGQAGQETAMSWGAGGTAGRFSRAAPETVSGAVRQAGAGSTPRLRLAGQRTSDGWIGGGRAVAGNSHGGRQPGGGRREPRLRLRGQRSALGAAGNLNGGGSAGPKALPRLRFGSGRRRDGALGSRVGSPAGLRPAALPRLRFGSGRSRGGVLSGGTRGSLSMRTAGKNAAVPRFRRRRGAGALGALGARNGNGLRAGALRGTAPRLKLKGARTWRIPGKKTGGYR